MLNELIEKTLESGIDIMHIYRHFKGGYYVVQSLASIESTGDEVVIYQSLQDGRVWVRPVSSFNELVPENTPNPTGQKYRFERVSEFNNQLKMVSTENLVKELLSRSDCPPEFANFNPDKIWRVEYLVGYYEELLIDFQIPYEDFNVLNIYDGLDRAIQYVKDHPRTSILKRVFIKQDFD